MYELVVATNVGILALLAMSLNLISGYAAQPTLGHAAFFGIGAYTGAILTGKYAWPFFPALAAGGLVAGLVGMALGLASLRIRDDFLAITTIGINFVVVAVFQYVPFFGASLGLSVPDPHVWGVTLEKPHFLLLVWALVGLTYLFTRWLERSWFGLALGGIRHDEVAAACLGIDVRACKVGAFALGCGLAGVAGGVYAHYMGFIMAGDFAFQTSVSVLSMAVLGGLGTPAGPLVGAAVLGVLPEVFRFVSDYRMLIYGGLLVLVLRFQPQGLLGRGSVLLRRWALARRAAVRRPVAAVQEAGPYSAPEHSPGDARRPLLEVRDLRRAFGGLRAVDGVSFSVSRGEVLGIIGPNGAGKTTLFNLVSGVLKPDGGEVLLNGRPVTGLPAHAVARLGVARTFQITRTFRDLTVLENVLIALGGKNYHSWWGMLQDARRPQALARARELLTLVGLSDWETELAGNLSLGHQRRLEVARALALSPQVLMLDEPVAGLSHEAALDFARMVRSLNERGVTILLVEHNVALASELCHRMVVLNYGRKIAEGAPAEVRANPEVVEAYLGREEAVA